MRSKIDIKNYCIILVYFTFYIEIIYCLRYNKDMENNSKQFYTNTDCSNMLKEFFGDYFYDTQTEAFFNNLHSVQTNKMYYKEFRLKVHDIDKMWGKFNYENYFDSESQKLQLNDFNHYQNKLYKKSLQYINYLHEVTHEKQRDYYIYNNQQQIKEPSQYNNLLNLEIFCSTEAKKANYEQLLVELDAIHNSIIQYVSLFEQNILPKTEETLSVVLYACVRYIASLNCHEHHTYCPENFVTNCDKLIQYYKDFYSNLSVKYASNYNKKLNDIIDDDENLCRLKKQELKSVDFDQIKNEVNNKTSEVINILNQTYNDILTFYKPSTSAKKFLNLTSDSLKNAQKQHNIVKLSAVICDDLHCKYIKSKPLIIKNITEEVCL